MRSKLRRVTAKTKEAKFNPLPPPTPPVYLDFVLYHSRSKYGGKLFNFLGIVILK